jgi:hypothetical protein
MRHFILFAASLTMIFLLSSENSLATRNSATASVDNKKSNVIKIDLKPVNNDVPVKPLPATKDEEPIKKTHLMKTEELAHIHHFHKERVKKLKRHHKKFWILTKILLMLCHLLILACAYSHLTH